MAASIGISMQVLDMYPRATAEDISLVWGSQGLAGIWKEVAWSRTNADGLGGDATCIRQTSIR